MSVAEEEFEVALLLRQGIRRPSCCFSCHLQGQSHTYFLSDLFTTTTNNWVLMCCRTTLAFMKHVVNVLEMLFSASRNSLPPKLPYS